MKCWFGFNEESWHLNAEESKDDISHWPSWWPGQRSRDSTFHVRIAKIDHIFHSVPEKDLKRHLIITTTTTILTKLISSLNQFLILAYYCYFVDTGYSKSLSAVFYCEINAVFVSNEPRTLCHLFLDICCISSILDCEL